MSAKYIVRLDDASEYMDYEKWNLYFELFDQYNISPIIAVIPENRDPKLVNTKPDNQFWNKVRNWENKKYVIALHGYQHQYSNKNSGIIGINNYSEFAGIPYNDQLAKLEKGLSKFNSEGISTKIFVAPAHSFDNLTIKALKQLKFEYISDGFYLNPVIINDLIWIPQQLWKPKKKKAGVWTICVHPETSNDTHFEILKSFIEKNSENFSHPFNLHVTSSISFFDKIFSLYLHLNFKLKYFYGLLVLKFS